MDDAKTIFITLLSGIAAYLAPIADNVFAMIWLFIINFVIGLATGILVEHEKFEWSKAWSCIEESAVLFGVVAAIYIIGRLNGNQEGAVQCVSMVIYAMCYFYGVRIMRNLRTILPDGTPAWTCIDFLYSLCSLEFAKKIPGLEDYLNKTKKEANK